MINEMVSVGEIVVNYLCRCDKNVKVHGVISSSALIVIERTLHRARVTLLARNMSLKINKFDCTALLKLGSKRGRGRGDQTHITVYKIKGCRAGLAR